MGIRYVPIPALQVCFLRIAALLSISDTHSLLAMPESSEVKSPKEIAEPKKIDDSFVMSVECSSRSASHRRLSQPFSITNFLNISHCLSWRLSRRCCGMGSFSIGRGGYFQFHSFWLTLVRTFTILIIRLCGRTIPCPAAGCRKTCQSISCFHSSILRQAMAQ